MIPRLAAALFLTTLAFAPIRAQEPEGFPDPGARLVDADFRVGTREFGLDRRVEMYQWRRGRDGGYERIWHGARIESEGFAPGHENPPALPLENRRWWASRPMLDSKPLDPAVLRALGEWRVLHPNFSRLPANLAAAFQPEGDGLGSAENPLDPQIGDLRVNWRELVLPPLAGKVELRDGVWRLRADAVRSRARQEEEFEELPSSGWSPRLWTWLGGGAIVLALLLALRRRRRSR